MLVSKGLLKHHIHAQTQVCTHTQIKRGNLSHMCETAAESVPACLGEEHHQHELLCMNQGQEQRKNLLLHRSMFYMD